MLLNSPIQNDEKKQDIQIHWFAHTQMFSLFRSNNGYEAYGDKYLLN